MQTLRFRGREACAQRAGGRDRSLGGFPGAQSPTQPGPSSPLRLHPPVWSSPWSSPSGLSALLERSGQPWARGLCTGCPFSATRPFPHRRWRIPGVALHPTGPSTRPDPPLPTLPPLTALLTSEQGTRSSRERTAALPELGADGWGRPGVSRDREGRGSRGPPAPRARCPPARVRTEAPGRGALPTVPSAAPLAPGRQ